MITDFLFKKDGGGDKTMRALEEFAKMVDLEFSTHDREHPPVCPKCSNFMAIDAKNSGENHLSFTCCGLAISIG